MYLLVFLLFEYEEVLLWELLNFYLSFEEVGELIDFYCVVGI